jgi:hypothetical protein
MLIRRSHDRWQQSREDESKTMKISLWAAVTLIAAIGAMHDAGAVTWTPPQTLAAVPAGVRSPSVAVNASGIGVAAWIGGDQVMVALRNAGGAWGSAVPLSAAGQGAAMPSTAVASDGSAVVAWLQDTPVHSAHVAFFDGVQWLPDSTISTPGVNAGAALVGFDGAGIATLVFQESGATCSINAVTGTATAGWSSPEILSGDCFTYLQFAMNSHGEAALAWGATVLQGGPVMVVTRDASGLWGAPVTVSPAYYRQVLPCVAIGEDGTAMVMWAKYTALTWSRHARGGAQWTPARAVPNTNVSLSRVAVDGAGNAVALYDSYTPQGTYALHAIRLARHGLRWGSHATLTSGTQSVAIAQLAASPAGTFVAGWTGSSPTRAMVSTLEPGAANWSTRNLGYGDWEIDAAAAPGNGAVVWETVYSPVPSIKASTAAIQ